MTNTVTIHPDDRVMWDRYVRLRRENAPQGAAEAGSIGGDDAVLVAAYLDNRLDEQEQAAFEARLSDEPALLDLTLASRHALDAPVAPAAVPQALTAFALGIAHECGVDRPARMRDEAVAAAPRRRWFLPLPGFAWSVATATFLGAFVIGAILTWGIIAPPMTAETAPDKAPLTEELRHRNNSVFDDPAKTIFDGMEVEE